MSFIGNVVTSFQKWVTDKISLIESKQIVTKAYVSAEQVITPNTLLTLPHGLPSSPLFCTLDLVCKVADSGYSIGDVIEVPIRAGGYSTSNFGATLRKDSTNLYIRTGNQATFTFLAINGTGVVTNLTNTSWRMVLRAYA